jgi:hypothetical protein
LVGAAVGLACLAFLIVGATRRRRAFAGAAPSVFDPPTVPFMPVLGAAPDTPTLVWQAYAPLDPPEETSGPLGVSSPPGVGPVSPEADDAPGVVDSPAQSGQALGVSSLGAPGPTALEPESPPTPNAATGDVAS